MRISILFWLAVSVLFAQQNFEVDQAVTRSRSLEARMKMSPASIASEYIPAQERNRLISRNPALAKLIEQPFSAEGTVDVVHVDREQMSPIHLISMSVDGERRTIYWDGDLPTSFISGSAVRVSGYHLGETFALSEPPTLTREAGNECSMSGPLKSLVLLLVPPGVTLAPDLVARTRDQFFSDAPESDSLNRFWKMNSFGAVSATGDVRVVNLRAAYTENQLDRMFSDMIAWSETNGIDLASISRLYIAYPLPYFTLGGFRAGGVATLGCRATELQRGVATMGVVWLTGQTATSQGNTSFVGLPDSTIYHESGHNFGLNHHRLRSYPDAVIQPSSVKPDISEYAGIFSSMATGSFDPFAAAHRTVLGWLREGTTLRTVTTTGEFTIVPPSSSGLGLRALRIPRRLPGNGDLWVEYLPQDKPHGSVLRGYPANPNGAVINFTAPDLTRHTTVDLLNMNPFSSSIKVDQIYTYPPAATLTPGKSFFDPESNLTIHVLEATASQLRVRVVMGPECGGTLTTSRLAVPFLPTEASMTLQAARPGCLVTASSPTSWIKIAPYSSTNTVNYTVEVNPTNTERTGVIYIDGRTVQVNQAASPVNRTPLLTSWQVGGDKSAGHEGRFAFNFVSPNQSQLRSFRIELRRPAAKDPVCILVFNLQAGNVQINLDGSIELRSSPVTPLNQSISNQLCRALFLQRDNNNTLSIAMAFSDSLAGDLNFQFTMTSTTGESVSYPMGSFKVEPNAPTVISNTSLRQWTGNTGVIQFQIQDSNGLDDASLTSITIQEFGSVNPPLQETCRFFVEHQSARLRLFSGDFPLNAVAFANFGQNIALQARACRLDASRAKFSITNQLLSVEVPVEFSPGLSLRRAVYVSMSRRNVFGQSFANANYPIGHWLSTAPTATLEPSSSALLSSLSGNSTEVNLKATQASGMGSIRFMEARFGSGEANNCWFRYEPASQRISLLNDTGNSWLGPLSIGGSAILENSQCSIAPQSTRVSGSLTSLEAIIPVRFKSGFNGLRPLSSRAAAVDATSGWQSADSFSVTSIPTPFDTSLSPVRGSGHRSEHTLSLAMPPTTGDEIVEFLIGTSPSRDKACSITMNLTLGRYSLSSNDGTSDSAPASFGASRRFNSQCALNQVFISRDFNRITASFSLFFEPGFAGEKNLYIRVPTSSSPAYRLVGRWDVTPDTLPHITMTPRFDSSSNTVFRLQATDVEGLEDLVYIFLNANSPQLACSLGWLSTSPNSIVFAGSLISLPSTAILRRTNCEIDASTISITRTNNSVTLASSFRFPGATEPVTWFASYIRAADAFNSRFSPAQHVGTWLPFPSPNPNLPPTVLSARQPNRAGPQLWLDLHSEDQDGIGDLQSMEAILGSSTDSPEACRIRYDTTTNSLALYDFSTELWSSPSPLLVGNRISNSACEVDPSRFTLSTEPKSLRLLGPVRATPASTSPLNTWIRASDQTSSTEWIPNGVFQPLPADQIFPSSVSISSATSNSATFLAEWGSLVGFPSGSAVAFRLVDPQQPNIPVCHLEWSPNSGQLRLLNDDGASFTESVPALDSTLANSKCTIKSQGFSLEGQRLQASFAMELLTERTSTFELQLSASPNEASLGDLFWVALGTWEL